MSGRNYAWSVAISLSLMCGAPHVPAQELGIEGGNTHPKLSGLHVGPQTSDSAEGRRIAFGGEHAALHVSCASCHQLDGTGDPSGAFPRLAQQDASYLYRSLRDFASGARRSGIMEPIAQELTDQAMRDVSAFYSSVSAQLYAPAAYVDPQKLAAGRNIAEHGASGESSCESCHGPQGKGVRNAFPYLAGQYAPYLEAQLEAFRQDLRRGSPAAIMHGIASGLTNEQIRDVSLYFGSLRPREADTAGIGLLRKVGPRGHPGIKLAQGATETAADMGAGRPH